MGWTGVYSSRPAKEIIAEDLTFANENGSGRIVKTATKLCVTYVAWERSYAAGTESMYAGKTFIMGVVVLHSRKDGEFVYKTITEDMGPCESECPASILDLLSPVEAFAEPGTDCHKWATNWRNRCREAIAKLANAPGDGATIRFKEPIKFTNGDTISAFTIHKRGRKVRFSVVGDGNAVYRISGWQQRDYEILPCN